MEERPGNLCLWLSPNPVLQNKMLDFIAPLDTNVLPPQVHSPAHTAGVWLSAQGADIPSVAHPQGLPPLRRDHSDTFDELLSQRGPLGQSDCTKSARPCRPQQSRTWKRVSMREGATTENSIGLQLLSLASHPSTHLRRRHVLGNKKPLQNARDPSTRRAYINIYVYIYIFIYIYIYTIYIQMCIYT